jgi:glycosyltransferase involved in cell wall biosynthesis
MKKNLVMMLTPQWTSTVGGPSTYVLNIIKELKINGWRAEVLCPERTLSANYYNDDKYWLTFFSVLRQLNALKPDIIHIHGRLNLIAPSFVYKCIRWGKIKIVFTFHTQPSLLSYDDNGEVGFNISYSGAKGFVGTLLLQLCDVITSVSKSIIDNLNCGTNLKVGVRYQIIPSGADPKKFKPSRLSRINRGSPVELTTIGVMVYDWKYKGHEICIQALALALKKNLNLYLNVVGGGRYLPRLVNLVQDLGIKEHVRFHENIVDVSGILSSTDIYIHMALNEGCSVSIIEAMLSGRPIIASDRGGNSEILTDCISGILIEPDPSILASKIEGLIDSFDLRERIAQGAVLAAMDSFTWPKIARNYMNLYSK